MCVSKRLYSNSDNIILEPMNHKAGYFHVYILFLFITVILHTVTFPSMTYESEMADLNSPSAQNLTETVCNHVSISIM